MLKTGRLSSKGSAHGKTALILWGGWDGHTPKACADLLAPWLASRGFRVKVSDTLDA
jgi:type 1 glutamine amidotransferase